jgi:5'-nucleotidase / UDP-sugar diphosphatase
MSLISFIAEGTIKSMQNNRSVIHKRPPTPFFSLCHLIVILAAFLPLAASPSDAPDSALYFTLLHTNDEHSALLPTPWVEYHPEQADPTKGGFARLSRLVGDIREAKRATGEPVVLVSAGDMLGGSPYYWLIPEGEAPELTIMKQIGYDAITIGNHEFDSGPEMLAHYFRTAGYPETNATTALLSSNLVIPEGHPLADCGIMDTHVVVLDNGLRLGFFGLLGTGAAHLATKKTPIEISDPAAAAAAAVQALRAQEVDIVIGLTHAGLEEDSAIAGAVPGIDIMVTGHCHTTLTMPLQVGNTFLVQTGSNLRNLGMLELAYQPATGTLRLRNEENDRPFLLPIDDSIEKDSHVARMIEGYTEQLNRLIDRLTGGIVKSIGDTILHSEYVLSAVPPLQESILGNFVTDAMRLVVEEKTGEKVDIAIQGNGLLRGNVVPGQSPHAKNKINFYDLLSTIGLGNGFDGNPGYPLASIYLSSSEIYRVLEYSTLLSQMYGNIFFLQLSGARYSFDPARAIYFKIPFTNLPLPSFGAVLEVELFTGSGPQELSPDAFRPLSRGDDTLYHVVFDYYGLSFFPQVAEVLPFRPVVPKDRHGKEIPIREAILQMGDQELKFWQAVVEYALAQAPDEAGIARAPAYYASPGSRIIQKETYPLVARLALLMTYLLF